jgi:hypothetical protein
MNEGRKQRGRASQFTIYRLEVGCLSKNVFRLGILIHRDIFFSNPNI